MQAVATQAIIPKARGMYAKRLMPVEYEELIRRRTVPEVAAALKKHSYFKESLATLSTTDTHRGQVEELLSMDIFLKYEALVHYDFGDEGFPSYFLAECEAREILKALHLLSIGIPGGYLAQMPEYLVGKTRLDLLALARAVTPQEVAEVARLTPYHKVLRARLAVDPLLRDFPRLEAVMLRQLYSLIFSLAGACFSGREKSAVEDLFLQEAEVYNIQLLVRAKTFFPHVYNSDATKQLLMPYTYYLTNRMLDEMTAAPSIEAFFALYKQSRAMKYGVPAEVEAMAHASGQILYNHARMLLHLTASPLAALAAFLTLAKLIRENVVNVVEGVRYNLVPENIRPMLLF